MGSQKRNSEPNYGMQPTRKKPRAHANVKRVTNDCSLADCSKRAPKASIE